ncbi:transcriptional regulator [Oceanobacillus arenosus]|uniref:Transcriptional regulator n=1 Tax=Oceanobacillus arenosus TaxID=1229153 RepID=A0A3D8PXY9_9BACI|nr:helix-turn-helix transcriptional regulator [Oceanobacillus arenosus]RDW21010.1 transcriptional regulator [Oceanobacillus arenosus]
MQWLLIRLRKEKELTQKQMARKMNLNITTYVNKENGKSPFKSDEMFFLRDFFGKPIEEIFLPTNCINNAITEKSDDNAAINR